MSLSPTLAERLSRARSDLRAGLPVALDAGGAVWLAAAAETLGTDRLAAFGALGTPVLALSPWRAATLKIAAYDGDAVRIALPHAADPAWLRAMADPAQDLSQPLKGPFRTVRDGDARPHRLALRLAIAAHLLPATVLVETSEPPPDLTRLTLSTVEALLDAPPRMAMVAGARVPLAGHTDARVRVFRPEVGGEDHFAVLIGRPESADAPLARVHSACFTGDVLGSLKCDCGPQLRGALHAMEAAGSGALVYLQQEGRGIGLANKMRAYALQDQGFDTVEANHRLGFADDERDLRLGAAILAALGIGRVRLMTNNPAKVATLADAGIEVADRVPLRAGRNPVNAHYLDTKAKKSGHIF